MAAPSYTTDLTTYNDCTNATNWGELVGMALSAPPDVDTDLAIHGSICITSDRAKVGLSSNVYDGAGITLTTGDCIFVWHKFFAPNSLSTIANGGVRVMVGDSLTVYDGWYVDGSDTYPYGGWVNYAVDPTTSPDQTVGTTTGTYATIGNGWNLPTQAPQKGNPFNTDIIRYGRGESRFTDGDLGNGYATFLGYSLVNDNPTTGRFGLIQAVGGGYLYKGLMSLGLTATSVDMRDSNVNISIDNTLKVLSSFNRIEVHNASSNVEWTSVNFTALGTVSKGEFEMIDNATVDMTACIFLYMDTFIFQSNATILGTTFQACDTVTSGGGIFTGSKVLQSTVTGATSASLIWDETTDPDGNLDDMEFSSGSTLHHAIYFGDTIPSSITLTGIDFQGFNPSNGQNNSTLYFADTTGTITVNLVGCSGDISYESAGAIILLVADPVTTEITVKDADSQAVISGVTVLAWVTDGTNFPYQASVTITGATTTATVHHTAHGLNTDDDVWLQGVNLEENYVGAYSITKITDDYYSYTTAQTIVTTTGTGPITATFCFFNGFTDANGEISDSRVVGTDQPFAYRCRKSTDSPLYKTGAGTETVSNTAGKSITVNLVSDE